MANLISTQINLFLFHAILQNMVKYIHLVLYSSSVPLGWNRAGKCVETIEYMVKYKV